VTSRHALLERRGIKTKNSSRSERGFVEH
jgi:hypothetical protein